MKHLRKFKSALFLATLVLLLGNCRKEILVPDPEMEKLFGTWEWVQSGGGLRGTVISPSTEGYTMEVEYKQNGIYKKHKDGNRVSKMTFEIRRGSSVILGENVFLIDYTEISLRKRAVISDSFKFSGNDTLLLFSECDDCFAEMYVRK